MTALLPRKRSLAALLLLAAALGGAVGAIDRARGVQPSASAIFSEPSRATTHDREMPVAAPVTSTAGAAAFSGADL